MQKFWLYIQNVALVLGCLFPASGLKANETPQGHQSHIKVEIKSFRFRKYPSQNFERLILEFNSQNFMETPVIRVTPSPSGNESLVAVDAVQMVGAIPESQINDSYTAKSKFLGPVSINTDGPEVGFNIRTFLKAPVMLDAFWAKNPNRLVLDAFPASSARSKSRFGEKNSERAERKMHRRLASLGTGASTESDIVCYPLSAAVAASVIFKPNVPALDRSQKTPTASRKENKDPVICFLASKAVVPSVAFLSKEGATSQYVQLLDEWGKGIHPGANTNESDEKLAKNNETPAPLLINRLTADPASHLKASSPLNNSAANAPSTNENQGVAVNSLAPIANTPVNSPEFPTNSAPLPPTK